MIWIKPLAILNKVCFIKLFLGRMKIYPLLGKSSHSNLKDYSLNETFGKTTQGLMVHMVNLLTDCYVCIGAILKSNIDYKKITILAVLYPHSSLESTCG